MAKQNKINVAGVVVFYHPTHANISNIGTYINDIDHLYIIDNSDIELDRSELSLFEKKISYCPLHKNYGLGYATNHGARIAHDDGYDWMLILDQDTKFEDNAISILKSYARKYQNEYSLFCPNITAIGDHGEAFYTLITNRNDNKEIHWATASGSLVNLKDFWSVGGVWADLFIEHLDV